MKIDGIKLENQMARKQLSIKKLSEVSGVSRATIGQIIRGKYDRNIKTCTAGKIANTVGCEIEEIRG